MRLHLIRRWKHPETKSVFGTLAVDGTQRFLTCEREWLDNKPGESCVPTGFYLLEPHSGSKYQNTFALIGSTVSHFRNSHGVTRSACVFHKASRGEQLQGCISIGTELTLAVAGARLGGLGRGKSWLAERRAGSEAIYLTITGDY